MKYAILLVFNYEAELYGNSRITHLKGALNDLIMMSTFCVDKGIQKKNITIITDIVLTPNICDGMNIFQTEYPSASFICTQLSQFIENTIRGITTNKEKSEQEIPEVLIYISCHGSEIKIEIPEERKDQAILLTDNQGREIRYLTTKDIFNILFGRLYINERGIMRVPIYRKFKTIKTYKEEGVTRRYEDVTSEVEFVNIQLSEPEESPIKSSSKASRSSYNSSRGIPFLSNVLIIADTCHSGNITHFPFIFKEDSFYQTTFIDTYVKHVDIPYCVCISACTFDKKTKSSSNGSQLTKLLFNYFRKIKSSLNFNQFNYHLFNNISDDLSPVISSTVNNEDKYLPFFGSKCIERPRLIVKTF